MLWKSGEDEEAVRRLKYLSACLLLRRPKKTITLPARRDLQCPVDFSNDERATYQDIRDRTITKIDDALHKSSDASKAGAYVNILQQIESLRLICNLGLYYHKRHDNHLSTPAESTKWTKMAQQTFNSHREMEPIVCSHCSSSLALTETLFDDFSVSDNACQFFRCLRFCCAECADKINRARCAISCGHSPPCPVASVSTKDIELEEIPGSMKDQLESFYISLPSKVQALVADSKSLPSDVKW